MKARNVKVNKSVLKFLGMKKGKRKKYWDEEKEVYSVPSTLVCPKDVRIEIERLPEDVAQQLLNPRVRPVTPRIEEHPVSARGENGFVQKVRPVPQVAGGSGKSRPSSGEKTSDKVPTKKPQPLPEKKKRGRKPKSDTQDKSSPTQPLPEKKKRGRKPKSDTQETSNPTPGAQDIYAFLKPTPVVNGSKPFVIPKRKPQDKKVVLKPKPVTEDNKRAAQERHASLKSKPPIKRRKVVPEPKDSLALDENAVEPLPMIAPGLRNEAPETLPVNQDPETLPVTQDDSNVTSEPHPIPLQPIEVIILSDDDDEECYFDFTKPYSPLPLPPEPEIPLPPVIRRDYGKEKQREVNNNVPSPPEMDVHPDFLNEMILKYVLGDDDQLPDLSDFPSDPDWSDFPSDIESDFEPLLDDIDVPKNIYYTDSTTMPGSSEEQQQPETTSTPQPVPELPVKVFEKPSIFPSKPLQQSSSSLETCQKPSVPRKELLPTVGERPVPERRYYPFTKQISMHKYAMMNNQKQSTKRRKRNNMPGSCKFLH